MWIFEWKTPWQRCWNDEFEGWKLETWLDEKLLAKRYLRLQSKSRNTLLSQLFFQTNKKNTLGKWQKSNNQLFPSCFCWLPFTGCLPMNIYITFVGESPRGLISCLLPRCLFLQGFILALQKCIGIFQFCPSCGETPWDRETNTFLKVYVVAKAVILRWYVWTILVISNDKNQMTRMGWDWTNCWYERMRNLFVNLPPSVAYMDNMV